MPELYEAADDVNQAHAEREQACAGVRAECADLVQSVEAGLSQPPRPELSPDAATWAIEAFSGLEPQSAMLAACAAFEQDERQFDPSYEIAADDPDLIRVDIEALMTEQTLTARNRVTTAQITSGVPTRVPAEIGQEAAGLTDEKKLTSQHETLQRLNDQQKSVAVIEARVTDGKEIKADELEQLQIAFNQLRADGAGAAGALRQVVAQAKSPETKQHLNAILSRVALLQIALPDKPGVVNRLLNTTGLKLAAATVAGSFIDFMAAAESDEDLSDADRTVLRNIIRREERYARDGTDVQDELRQTLTTPDGKTVPAHPEDQPYQFREQVQGFARADGSQHLRAVTTHGERVTLDITGWPAADVGRASELLQLWAMTENEGQTGYLTALTKLNWSGTAQIDPIALLQASQVVSALLGHGEGHDGDIFDGRETLGMIRWQAQLANQTGATLRGIRDEGRTHDALIGLGIRDEKGNLDLDVLRAFGDFSRDHWMTAPKFDAVQMHLAKFG
ncbi:MAG: hypothetical protein QNJ44_05045 [Rhodobacter sp.]|nr:hypothetical protein [Rhodobacter sp.]